MAYLTNTDKMLQAVLQDEELMEFGRYSYSDITSIYQALDSENPVINAVAQIINEINEGVSEKDLWKQVNQYLKDNL